MTFFHPSQVEELKRLFGKVVYRIRAIEEVTDHFDRKFMAAIVEKLHEFDMGEWDVEPAENLLPAIEAVHKKATCYHCRSPHYVKEDEEK